MEFDALTRTHALLAGLGVAVYVALLYVWGYKTRTRVAVPSLNGRSVRNAHIIRVISAGAVVSLLGAALLVDTASRFKEKKTGIVAYACDESRSMGAEDAIGRSRIDRCKNVILALDQFPYAYVRSYGFTTGASSHSSFSTEHDHFRNTVRYLVAIEAVPGSGSDIGVSARYIVDDIAEKNKELKKKSKIAVIVSDGENVGHAGNSLRVEPAKFEDVVVAAHQANKNGIKFVTVFTGGSSPVPIPLFKGGNRVGFEEDREGKPILTKGDEEMLRFLAERTGGIFVSEGEVAKAVTFIDRELAMEKIEVEGTSSPIAGYILYLALVPLVTLLLFSTITPPFF